MKPKPPAAPVALKPITPRRMFMDRCGEVFDNKWRAHQYGVKPSRPVLVLDAIPQGVAALRENLFKAITKVRYEYREFTTNYDYADAILRVLNLTPARRVKRKGAR